MASEAHCPPQLVPSECYTKLNLKADLLPGTKPILPTACFAYFLGQSLFENEEEGVTFQYAAKNAEWLPVRSQDELLTLHIICDKKPRHCFLITLLTLFH